MHAESIVARFIEQALAPIHGARRRVLAAVVWAAMRGHVVSLSRLARGMVGRECAAKAALKRVDRLVGHARIEREVGIVAQALLVRLARWMSPLVLAVDWSAVTPGGTFAELRAAVVWPGMGRGLTVYQRVYPAKLRKRPVTTPCPVLSAVARSRALLKESRGGTGIEAVSLVEAGGGIRAQRPVAAGVVRGAWLERVVAGRLALPAAA